MANNSRQPESSSNVFYPAIFTPAAPPARKSPSARAAKNPSIRLAHLCVYSWHVQNAAIGAERGRAPGTGFAAVVRNLSVIHERERRGFNAGKSRARAGADHLRGNAASEAEGRSRRHDRNARQQHALAGRCRPPGVVMTRFVAGFVLTAALMGAAQGADITLLNVSY